MKPVAQKPLPQIPQLSQQSQEFWNYTLPSNQELEALDLFLTPNAQLIQSYLPLPIQNLEETYLALCQILQIRPHPSIKIKTQKQSQGILGHDNSMDSIPAQTELSILQYVIFQNTQIDMITLRIITFLWQFLPDLQVLKIFNICPTEQEVNEICNLIQKNKITKVFLEFLQVDSDQLFQICEAIPKSIYVNQLYLRGNRLNDDHLSIFMKVLEENIQVTNLSFIEITYNNISKKGVTVISQFMKKLNKIEYIGLAKNQLGSWDDVRDLTDLLIRKKMSPEELQTYRDQEAELDAQMKAQQKNKGKKTKDVQLIQQLPITQNQDGSYSMVQNNQFKVLNLAMNNFQDSDKDLVDKFMAQVQDSFQLILLLNTFESKVKDKLKKKYKNLVI